MCAFWIFLMIGQQIQSNIISEKFVINVTQRDVIKKAIKQKSLIRKLKQNLRIILKIVKSKRRMNLLSSFAQLTSNLLNEYVSDVNDVINNVENAINKSQIQHLKLIQKIDSLLEDIEKTKINTLRLKGKYPFDVNTHSHFYELKKAINELSKLQVSIGRLFKSERREIRREEISEIKVARNIKPYKPFRLYLVSKNIDEMRNVNKERIYLFNEENLECNLKKLEEKFLAEKGIIDSKVEESYAIKFGVKSASIENIQNPYGIGFLAEDYSRLSQLIFAYVYDVKNLLAFYRNHFHSVTNLQIDLEIDEAEKLRELGEVANLLENIPLLAE